MKKIAVFILKYKILILLFLKYEIAFFFVVKDQLPLPPPPLRSLYRYSAQFVLYSF